jgi:type IV pilus assembly protein PilY1
VWSAATQLDAQAAVAGAVNGWDTRRRIVTINAETSAAVPFRLASLSAAQQASLNAGWSSAAPIPPTPQSVLNYLRGDKSNEGVNTTSFRARSHILGDIVYSAAVPVGAPNAEYLDTGAVGSPNPGYNAFKTSKSSRAPAVYVGANDGMLHAFDDTVANGGQETWAYIPKALFSGGDPNDSLHTPDPAFQLGALTYRRGGIPLQSRKFYVNATPRVADIDFANTNTSTPPATDNDWRTILVGGLGAGGRAVYALDVTDPVAAPPPVVSSDTETTVATKVLWEYTEANLGYVYDAPTLAKTYAYGWVVLVASGYNNPGGKGFLYVLNPKSSSKAGQLLAKIPLPGDPGTDLSPTGLGTIRAFTASRQNPYALQAYGGDLKGNVWRFDLSNPDASKWKAELIATLKDASNKAQPITSGVRIEIDQNNNVDRYLFVGTGKLLDQPDLTDTSITNSLYVIKDGNRNTPEPAPGTPYSRSNLNAVTGTSISGFSDTATGRGWYQDATNGYQKVNSDVHADLNIVAFAFSEPSSDPCLSALTSTLIVRELTTGNSVLLSSGGSVIPSVSIGGGIAGVALIQSDPGVSNATPTAVVQVTTMDGAVRSFNANISAAVAARHRFSWSLVSQ